MGDDVLEVEDVIVPRRGLTIDEAIGLDGSTASRSL
jgi:hypothetical protein